MTFGALYSFNEFRSKAMLKKHEQFIWFVYITKVHTTDVVPYH